LARLHYFELKKLVHNVNHPFRTKFDGNQKQQELQDAHAGKIDLKKSALRICGQR
jgi:hypothetical protein